MVNDLNILEFAHETTVTTYHGKTSQPSRHLPAQS